MQSIKSIVVTYPDYQSLPKGVKRMLVTSESLFFRDARTAPMKRRDGTRMVNPALAVREELIRERAPFTPDSWFRN
jgi:hypothetical protein